MTTPMDDDHDPRTKYAPRWARPIVDEADMEPEPEAPDIPDYILRSRLRVDDAPPSAPVAPGARPVRGAEPADEWPRRGGRPFEGDVAIRELNERLALHPDIVPEPRRAPRRRWGRTIGRAALTLTGAVGLAAGLMVFGMPLLDREMSGGVRTAFRPASPRPAAEPAAPAVPARLSIGAGRFAAANEIVPLPVSPSYPIDGHLAVGGLPAGARLTTGAPLAPNGWLVPIALLPQTSIVPPPDFVGPINLVMELRRPDDTVLDRGTLQIAWGHTAAPAAPPVQASAATPAAASAVPSSPATESVAATTPATPAAGPVRRLDPEETAALIKRGQELLASGDLASARLMLRRAAEGGSAAAALLLGSTYDPATFRQLVVIGETPDQAQAHFWYQRAAELGSTDAARRLDLLARGVR
ncbi:hypothetical protein PQJ75_25865 [Rhodoplanes sp. TEM]|uniref:Sel1 repeat family protein n=1 Tax=Rhodoplanes tepidamans TaxID=200616 RepID=A0ABT5JF01_RHOTP|nr:hypothetical protein [Rhodoplanes tepidamans]MDC7788274.1 hypothetical protein [Rhodoplanes tepidamans]MDC7987174.1 hypothetical protein [Rhodoplanes sp. TEM]MDQ0355674.1 hypothetical protein [Rhodoplanes tepidamans]